MAISSRDDEIGLDVLRKSNQHVASDGGVLKDALGHVGDTMMGEKARDVPETLLRLILRAPFANLDQKNAFCQLQHRQSVAKDPASLARILPSDDGAPRAKRCYSGRNNQDGSADAQQQAAHVERMMRPSRRLPDDN